ncbi:MAG: sigma-70 family RNA polymerase sigma factor [Planctomycetales bacterium]|nr:sigma-70 family RNA polymerase sigma factor [Planctomycetales bacterium]
MEQSASKIDPSKWLERHGDVMFAFAFSRLKDRDAAEEVVQEAFVGALRNIALFRSQGSEGAWLMGVLKKKVIDRIRTNSKRALSLEGEDQVVARLFDERGNWSDAARKAGSLRLDSMEQGEFRELFELCLEGLPSQQAAVFVLKEVHQKNSEDVCKELRISSTNLWVLMHRARLRLAECIKARWAMGDA